jgi:ABC-type Mn2+/Zn2+ transport system permease subunit
VRANVSRSKPGDREVGGLRHFGPLVLRSSSKRKAPGLLAFRLGCSTWVLAVLTALTVALSMRVVGILLIAALMVLPVIAATRLAASMRSTLLISIAVGLGSVLAGLTVAYYADMPPGGTVVLIAAAVFLLASGAESLRSR